MIWSYFSIMFEVTLIAHQYHRNVISVLYAVDQLLIFQHLLKTTPICDGITQDEALAIPHVLVTHCCEFWLQTNILYQNSKFKIEFALVLIWVNYHFVVFQTFLLQIKLLILQIVYFCVFVASYQYKSCAL